ncbi:MAG TPA: GntR family transcriptional regulator [Micromonosporaceae bacterium]|nr:GntR family transcriptional regulator [Micromonosporaceae bacterium]
MSAADPAYLRIAAELRERIAAGELGPGARLPSESRLMADHGVSRTVAKWAISVLKGEGLVEGRRGSGVFVRAARQLVREVPDAAVSAGVWEHDSAHATADERIAARLAVEPGVAVMRTDYRLLDAGVPAQLATSWEPLGLTGGTAAEWPGTPAGNHAGKPVRNPAGSAAVVDRMRTIGVRVDEMVERVTARPARAAERAALGLPARVGQLLAVERTHLAGGVPVETADIVVPADRYELRYRVPVE